MWMIKNKVLFLWSEKYGFPPVFNKVIKQNDYYNF